MKMKKLAMAASACAMLISGISAMPVSAEPTLYGTTYFSEYIGNRLEADGNIGVNYAESYETWQAFLDAEAQTNDYLGTPYYGQLWAASPNFDRWQGIYGTNCNGFVWHITSNGLVKGLESDLGIHLSDNFGTAYGMVSKYLPNANSYNSSGYAGNRKSLQMFWSGWIRQYGIHYYQFMSKSEMLSSGVLHKGDVIWCVNPYMGKGFAGLCNPSGDHHVGIYYGDGSNDLWWHSGIRSGERNAIEKIRSAYSNCTYVVLPWNAVTEATVEILLGDADRDASISVEDAVATLQCYARASAGTDSEQIAEMDVDGNSLVEVADAVLILKYYAQRSAGLAPDWETILNATETEETE